MFYFVLELSKGSSFTDDVLKVWFPLFSQFLIFHFCGLTIFLWLLLIEWIFSFGFVIPGSTNSWEQTIEAAPPSAMHTAEELSGNITIETSFLDNKSILCKNLVRVFYVWSHRKWETHLSYSVFSLRLLFMSSASQEIRNALWQHYK